MMHIREKTCPSATFVTTNYTILCHMQNTLVTSIYGLRYTQEYITQYYLCTDIHIYRKHQLVPSRNCDACRKHQPFVSLDGVIRRMYLQYVSNIQLFKHCSFHQPHIRNIKFTESSASEHNNHKQSSTAGRHICSYIKNNKHNIVPAHFQRLCR